MESTASLMAEQGAAAARAAEARMAKERGLYAGKMSASAPEEAPEEALEEASEASDELELHGVSPDSDDFGTEGIVEHLTPEEADAMIKEANADLPAPEEVEAQG